MNMIFHEEAIQDVKINCMHNCLWFIVILQMHNMPILPFYGILKVYLCA